MKPALPKLENWCLQKTNPNADPESVGLLCMVAVGTVSGHPTHPDGEVVMTASIVSCFGRIIDTFSGREYELGEPKPDWVQWLKDNGLPVPNMDGGDVIVWHEGAKT